MTPDQVQRLEGFHRQHAQLQPWCLEAMAEEPELFGIKVPTRGELRALPTSWIAWQRPALIFPTDCAGQVLLHDLREWSQRYAEAKKARDIERFKRGAIMLRRTWVRMVELAVGVNVDVGGTLITVRLRDV